MDPALLNNPLVPIIVFALCVGAPFWTPFIFIAYAFGRRTFSIKFLFALTTAEAVALLLFAVAYPVLQQQEHIDDRNKVSILTFLTLLGAPLFLPLLITGFAVGRRSLNQPLYGICLIAFEMVAIVFACGLLSYILQHPFQ